ncbi:nitrite reductase/ring-hydroxylating ferredoxin subunit [Sphingomonas vulcanisoli]|uniref:Nitrite reductase/ring-hydroxylating ferredoxin subunit n=1 Tax=Sphingomonas vulcanisoli TaxID=1658060 RepID=A0ABX0TW19_9SPHN|nr:non-heme iron oxygenase ferredoxin subunit [Sphingomonas vulcanisoli]NIJ09636.1 nitrite reductase/ring-hydroxylating ferredoxin subunit [Sphingomonas vulcanisoli]
MSNAFQEAWISVAAVGDVIEEKPTVAKVDEAEIAIFKIDGEYFAISNVCTHVWAPLSRGRRDGFVIACPLHWGLFDIRDGSCQGGPVDVDLASYDVRVVDERIEVRLRN